MHFGFSYVGLIFLVMLFVPNIIWAKHQPKGYDQYAKNENKILLALERAGEVLVTALVLIFSDFNVQGFGSRLIWLAAALILMIMYEVFWIRYFKSEMTMKDFYSSLLGIPVAGATLPVCFSLPFVATASTESLILFVWSSLFTPLVLTTLASLSIAL